MLLFVSFQTTHPLSGDMGSFFGVSFIRLILKNGPGGGGTLASSYIG